MPWHLVWMTVVGARIGFIVANPLIKEIGGCRPAHGLVGVDEDEEPVLKLFLQMSSPIWAGTLNPWWSTSNVAHLRCRPRCRAARGVVNLEVIWSL